MLACIAVMLTICCTPSLDSEMLLWKCIVSLTSCPLAVCAFNTASHMSVLTDCTPTPPQVPVLCEGCCGQRRSAPERVP